MLKNFMRKKKLVDCNYIYKEQLIVDTIFDDGNESTEMIYRLIIS